ncbi:MAG: hypothetical protein WAO29_02035 [Candidatus Nanopelagicales bacterium]
MITLIGGPMDGEQVPNEFYNYYEVHIQNGDSEPVYIYCKDEETGNYKYEGEFSSSEIEYEEDEDE